jgi:hypothetical protein
MCSGCSVTVPWASEARSGEAVFSSMPCSFTSSWLNSAVPESCAGFAAGPETVMAPAIFELPLKVESGEKRAIALERSRPESVSLACV